MLKGKMRQLLRELQWAESSAPFHVLTMSETWMSG
jgi:hypothetical protein